MKGKAIIPLVIGLCIGLFAVKFLLDTIQKAKGAGRAQETYQLIRAKVDLDSFEAITGEAVELIETTDSALAPGTERIASLEEVIGRVTAKAIPQYAPVLRTMLAPEGTPPGMVGRIPPGFRAVSVKIDEVTGVAYQIKPGDWVDVIVVMDVDSAGLVRKKDTIAEVILQHVQVAAIGQAMESRRDAAGSKVNPAKSATLLVAEEDVPKLHLVATRGKITLSMRGEDDTTTGEPPVAYGDEVFGASRGSAGPTDRPSVIEAVTSAIKSVSPPMPAEPALEPEEPHGVTVVHGSTTEIPAKIEQFTFANEKSRTILALSEGPVNRGMALVGNRTRTPAVPRRLAPSMIEKDSISTDEFERTDDQEAE